MATKYVWGFAQPRSSTWACTSSVQPCDRPEIVSQGVGVPLAFLSAYDAGACSLDSVGGVGIEEALRSSDCSLRLRGA